MHDEISECYVALFRNTSKDNHKLCSFIFNAERNSENFIREELFSFAFYFSDEMNYVNV